MPLGHLPIFSYPKPPGALPLSPTGDSPWGPPAAPQHLLVAPASVPSASKAVRWLRSGPMSVPGLSLVLSTRCRGSVPCFAACVSRADDDTWKRSSTGTQCLLPLPHPKSKGPSGGTDTHTGCFCFAAGRCTWPAWGCSWIRALLPAQPDKKGSGGRGWGGEGGAMNQSGVPSPASSSWLGRLLPITQPGSVYSRSTIPPCLSCWLRAGECTARWGWAFHTPTAKQILQPLKREICCFLALFRAARAHAWLAGRAHAQTTQLPAAPSPRLLDLSPSCSACTQSTARAVSSAVHLSSSDSEEAEHPSPKLDAARLFSPLEEMREQKRSLGWMHSTNKAVPRMLSPCSCNKAPWAAASNRTSLGCCVSAAPQHRDPLTPHPGTGVAEGKGLTLIQSFSGLVL